MPESEGPGGQRVFFTGGSGKAGRHVVPYLMARGHLVLNADLVPLEHPGVRNLLVDVTDSGQVFNALTGYTGFDELEPGGPPRPFDAVVHFAAVPRILLRPDSETFRVNALGTYAVVEAAAKLGVRKIVVASSETAYGVCFANGRADPDVLPVDEEHRTEPMDSYALSKVVNEATACAFQRRTGADVYALRIGNVIEPHEHGMFAHFDAHPEVRRRNLFNYVDARDLGQIVHRCLEVDGLGYQVFNAANDGNSVDLPAAEIAERFYPGVPLDHPLGRDEGLYSNRKAREVLGFREEHPRQHPTDG